MGVHGIHLKVFSFFSCFCHVVVGFTYCLMEKMICLNLTVANRYTPLLRNHRLKSAGTSFSGGKLQRKAAVHNLFVFETEEILFLFISPSETDQ